MAVTCPGFSLRTRSVGRRNGGFGVTRLDFAMSVPAAEPSPGQGPTSSPEHPSSQRSILGARLRFDASWMRGVPGS